MKIDITVPHNLPLEQAKDKLLALLPTLSNSNVKLVEFTYVQAAHTVNFELDAYGKTVLGSATLAPNYLHLQTEDIPVNVFVGGYLWLFQTRLKAKLEEALK